MMTDSMSDFHQRYQFWQECQNLKERRWRPEELELRRKWREVHANVLAGKRPRPQAEIDQANAENIGDIMYEERRDIEAMEREDDMIPSEEET